MKLTEENYTVSRATLEKVLEALGNNWFYDGGDRNNEDVIDAYDMLVSELASVGAPRRLHSP